jgi:sensor c-di-GMP phosphodiesterase-like protein
VIRDAFELEMSLRQALQRDEFEIHYQPILDGLTGELRSAEALLT